MTGSASPTAAPHFSLKERGACQHHASLDKFRHKFGKRLGDAYILYTKDIMVKNDIYHLPLYMAMFL